MAPKQESQSVGAVADASAPVSMDPFLHILKLVPYSFLHASASGSPPSPSLRPCPGAPGIGSTQDPATGAVRPVVFLLGRVNGQYIIEGLSSGFMFVVGGIGIVLFDLALDKNRARSIKVSYSITGISSIVIAYVMTTLFIRIKIPGYLSCVESSYVHRMLIASKEDNIDLKEMLHAEAVSHSSHLEWLVMILLAN
ncbi:hypothetical protein F3Y22_tig00112688pilonHSYRG00059 [Hibiscus syriacus]|uniref:Uncharacterized protein n=1 Tax=Hibiscus syriacus TaxID=106335 RepID=A0A6A2Y4B7_HIBSY|nr:hypothetical protein F3Y22_tig00112688pilonHSYRG00059 [Hibiscus syriacus]